jgi:cutinase
MKFTPTSTLISASLLSFVFALPASNSDTDAIIKAVKAEGTPLRQSAAAATNVTENGLEGACKAVTLIFARETDEAGNVGESVGPPLFSVLRSEGSIGGANLAVQGVDYSATLQGYFQGGDPAGSKKMKELIEEAASKCPETKIVIGGYSQGAQLTHNAAKELNSTVASRIAAAFVLGDPFNGEAIGSIPASNVLSICHDQDLVCAGQGDFDDHLNYDQDVTKVAEFIVGRVSEA